MPPTIGEILKEKPDAFDAYDMQVEWPRLSLADQKARAENERQIAETIRRSGAIPTFTILGGRACSGKEWFRGRVYNPDKSVVLDADDFMAKLPEYEGWNAPALIAEATDIVESALDKARLMGLNVVLDATMRSAEGAIAKIAAFRAAGYRIEAHYMFLPREEAAKRAVARSLGKSKHYVPIEAVLANTTNETTFDQIRPLVDKWSVWDNNVPEGQDPKLIAQGGDSE